MPHISDPLLQAYIDGFCSDARVDEIASHIEGCGDCRARLESARDTAQRASQLLGALDPGPVHAPSFEELQARASARASDAGAGAAGAFDVDRGAVTDVGAGKIEPPLPFWRRPAMAWAATLVIAFGLGWLSSSRLNLRADLTAPSSSALDGLGVKTPAAASEPGAPGEAELREGLASADELDDVESAAKRAMGAEIEAGPPATEAEAVPSGPPPAAIEDQVVPRQQVAENRAAPGAAGAQPATGQRLAAAPPPAQEPAAPAAASLERAQPEEMNEQRVGAVSFADAGVTPGFVAVALEDAELWLGVAPRVIPDLTLLRVEVGPGALVESGILSRAAIRLVYVDSSGQQVALLQQYAGAIKQPELAPMGQVSGGRAAVADAPSRAERARETEDFRADRRAGADRDAVVDALVDLPAYVREPDGRVTYRWRDADGYVLSISADLDPDVLRGLADRIR